MSTANLESAIQATRAVLVGVTASQLDDDTPCASWNVRELVNHIVGGQNFFAAAVAGDPMGTESPDFASDDFVASFDEASARTLASFSAPGASEKMLTLPFGTMPGSAFCGLATTDTFVHGWDLAKATGQPTDLNPELATVLLGQARTSIGDAMRSPEGNPFGPATVVPPGASAADELAAYLGRSV